MGRRDKNIAKLEIYEVFRSLVESGSQKVTVSGIIEKTGMNRKTFYNHFSSQDELAAWGFRFDLASTLKADDVGEDLIYLDDDRYGFSNLPCYFRTPDGTLSLDQTPFFRSLERTLRANEPYYRALLRSAYSGPFLRYLIDVFTELFLGDIDYFLGGRKMPVVAKEYIASFFAEGVAHNAADSLADGKAAWNDISDIAPIGNLAHESMHHLVEAYQNEKASAYFAKQRPL